MSVKHGDAIAGMSMLWLLCSVKENHLSNSGGNSRNDQFITANLIELDRHKALSNLFLILH